MEGGCMLCLSPICSTFPNMQSMEKQPSNGNGRREMEEELIKGHNIANQLLQTLRTHHGGVELEGSLLPFAEDLVCKVLISFTNTLLLLNIHNSDVSDEVLMPIITMKDVSSSVKCIKPEGCKSKSFFSSNRKRRCQTRKSSAPTWEKNSSILMEDGYAWGKYGQKMTMNAKYLRSYYRCSYNYDEGCPATKQVQRIQEDPPLYRTTYYGHHNCKSSLSPEMMMETASSSSGSSMILSFSNTFTSKEEFPFSSSLSSSMEQEPIMEVIPDYHSVHNQLPSSDHYLQSCDNELDFNYLRHVTMLSSTDYCDQFNEVLESGLHFGG